jgi:uncharacterized RDD family membrane protein YckC
MSDVVTGEAVRLELPAATFASRAVSGALDLASRVVLLVVAFGVLGGLGSALDEAAAAALGLVVVVTAFVGVPVLVETLSRGRSLGKLTMGLRAVRDDGGPIRFRHALVRGLVGFVELGPPGFGVPALLCSLLSARGKRLGDVAAGTYVVRERGAGPSAPPAQMPPHLAAWAAGADLGRPPDGLALALRQFLGRAPTMHPAARWRMGADLARALAPHVAPAPPVGTDPEAFLAAVLAERRRRDLHRLAREQDLRRRLSDVDSVEHALRRAGPTSVDANRPSRAR